MTRQSQITISLMTADEMASRLGAFGELLHACVHDGASIGFIVPFGMAESEAFWINSVVPAVRNGTRALLVAEQEGRIVGSVQLDHDTPPNQPHRAEARKLLVHPACRRRGIGRALMIELEIRAKGLERSLITLDTRTGDTAEPLYASLGYRIAGFIPGYCLDPFARKFDSTTVMYKRL